MMLNIYTKNTIFKEIQKSFYFFRKFIIEGETFFYKKIKRFSKERILGQLITGITYESYDTIKVDGEKPEATQFYIHLEDGSILGLAIPDITKKEESCKFYIDSIDIVPLVKSFSKADINYLLLAKGANLSNKNDKDKKFVDLFRIKEVAVEEKRSLFTDEFGNYIYTLMVTNSLVKVTVAFKAEKFKLENVKPYIFLLCPLNDEERKANSKKVLARTENEVDATVKVSERFKNKIKKKVIKKKLVKENLLENLNKLAKGEELNE